MESEHHLDMETLALVVEGQCPPERRAEVNEHLNSCPDCYELVIASSRFLEQEPQARPSARRRWLWLIAPALAAAAALVVLFWPAPGQGLPRQLYADLAAEVALEQGYATVRFRLPLAVPDEVVAARRTVRSPEQSPFESPTFEQLQEALSEAETRAADRPEARRAKISTLLLTGHYSEALDAANQALAREPGKTDLQGIQLVAQYALLRARGLDQQAAQSAQELIQLAQAHPDDADLAYNAAIAAMELGAPEAEALIQAYLKRWGKGPHADFLAHR